MAPVLQMDLSSRTACDLILSWLDQQKVAGVMICIPRHELEQLTTAFVYSVIMGCVVRNLPLSLEGPASSPFWKGFEQLPQEQRPHHRVEFEWLHWNVPAWGRALIFSNMPEITIMHREALLCTPQNSLSPTSHAGYPVAFATALAEVFIAGLTARQLPSLSALERVCDGCAGQKDVDRQLPLRHDLSQGTSRLLHRSHSRRLVWIKALRQAWQVPAGVRVLPGLTTLPMDSQLLSRTQTGGSLSPQLQQEMQKLKGASVLRVGIP